MLRKNLMSNKFLFLVSVFCAKKNKVLMYFDEKEEKVINPFAERKIN